MSVDDILSHYGFVDSIAARNLKIRATGGKRLCLDQRGLLGGYTPAVVVW